MVFSAERVAKDVKVCIDENVDNVTLVGAADTDTLTLEEIIRSKILEGVRRVHSEAPAYLLEQGHNFGGEERIGGVTADPVHWGDMESGWVLLPDDFMRLVVFEMSDWEQAVYRAITPEDPTYRRQRSRVKALRGTAQRPVCVLSIRPEGKVLEFYSCTSEDAKVTRGVYMPYPEIDNNGGIDISEACYDAVIWTTAALVLQTVGERDKAKEFTEIARSAL